MSLSTTTTTTTLFLPDSRARMRDGVQEHKGKDKIEEWKAKHFEDIQAWHGFLLSLHDIDVVHLYIFYATIRHESS